MQFLRSEPALAGDYRIRTHVLLDEPKRGAEVTGVELLLNTDGAEHAGYLLELRVRNGVRYLTLTKRANGVVESLVDDIVDFDFDQWLQIDVSLIADRFTIWIDERLVVECVEFDRLTGHGIAIGGEGGSVRTDSFRVSAESPSPVDTGQAVEEPTVSRRPVKRDPTPRRVSGSIENSGYRLAFVEADTEIGLAYLMEISVADRGGWLPVTNDDRWLVMSGDAGSRRNLYASTTCRPVVFTELELIDAQTARLSAQDAGFRLTVTWSLASGEPSVISELTPGNDGHHLLAYQGFTGRHLDFVDEVLCGPMQHARMVRGVESIGAAELSAPLNLVQYTENGRPVTVGLSVAPAELPLTYEPTTDDAAQPFGMSLRNDRGEVQPVLFAPQYGRSSAIRAGETRRFEFRVYAGTVELFEAYRHLLRTMYAYSAYRRNVYGSLTDAVHNMIDLLTTDPVADDSVEFRGSPSGWWSRAKGFIDIENDQAVRTTTTAVFLSAYYLTADDDVYDRRARPTIEYHLSRNGYGWTPDRTRTVYGDPTKNRICSVPFGTPALAPLYAMAREQIPAVRKLAKERVDDQDYWLKRTPMSGPLAAYRLTGEGEDLQRAEAIAHDYAAREIAVSYTENVDPHDFANYYTKAWVELLEMYEETGDRPLLQAAVTEARRFVTQLCVRPVSDETTTVPTRPVVRNRQIELSGWWDPNALYDYPNVDIPDEEVPYWVISPTGLGFEALKTYRLSGYSMNPAWAPFLLRLATYADDDLLLDIAHNAIIGRFTNYPGYYYRQFSVNHMRPDFPYTGPFDNTTIYYHHAPAQLGMTMDYLLTEHQTRSAGNIAFPAEFEQNYVWFAYRLYGHRPGTFYGHENAWLWMPRGLVSPDNEQINWIAATDGERLFVSLTNESNQDERPTLTLDGTRLGLRAEGHRVSVYRDNGPPAETTMVGDAIEVTVSGRGITALVVHSVGPLDIPLHREPERLAHPERTYHLDDETPVGAVWGVLLPRPDGSRFDAYVQAATDGPATLHYSTDGGATWHRLVREIYPNEWTVPVADRTATFTYWVESDGRNSEAVELSCV